MCSNRRDVLVWMKRVRDSESNLFVLFNIKKETRYQSTTIVVRVAGKNTWRSQMTDAWLRVLLFMNAFGTGV